MRSIEYLGDLTVYVIASGEETHDECLEALQNQDCTFKVEHIRDVSPMSRAFQTMPDRCTTRYFVQVDADMILHPHAVRTLYQAVRRSSLRTYLVYGRLYEEGKGLGGTVKCWKRAVFRFFRFRDVRTVDRDLYRRLQLFGLKRHDLNEVLGIHRPRYSDFSLYLKSKSDIEKWRFLRRPAARYAVGFLEKAIQGYPASRQLLFGALLGALTGPERLVRSKDIPLEKARFHKELNFLSQDERLSCVADLPETYIAKLIDAFVRSYEDYRGYDRRKREALVQLILGLFSQEPSRTNNVEEFLKIIDE